MFFFDEMKRTKMINKFIGDVFRLCPAVGFSTVAINYVFEPTAKKKQVSDVTCCCVQEHGHAQDNTKHNKSVW